MAGLHLDLNSLISAGSQAVTSATPGMQQSKDRAAAVVDFGYSINDTLTRLKPGLFILGVLGLAGSGYMLYKRRKAGAEAIALYSTSAAISAALAWFFRPGQAAVAVDAQGNPDPNAPGAGSLVLAKIDARAASLRATDPQFASKVFNRLINDVGSDKIPAAARALLVN